MIHRIQLVNNVKSELHKNITVRRGKKKSYVEIVREWSSKNNEDPSSSEELVSMDELSKNSVYKMEINNGVGNMGLSEHHKKVHESTALEKGCDEDIQGFRVSTNRKQELKIQKVKR